MSKTRTQPRLHLTVHYRPRRDTHRLIERYTCASYELTPAWVILQNAQPVDWENRPTTRRPRTRLAIPTHRIAQLTQH